MRELMTTTTTTLAAENVLRLNLGWLDYVLIAIYFVFVLGIGFIARSQISTSLDFFLSGRRLPAWVTGLAFISANLGAIEIMGMAANGAEVGISTMHYYWIGAVPAMLFLGVVMIPFYYGSNVRSVSDGKVSASVHDQLTTWPGQALSGFDSPVWSVIGIVFGLGFVLSFGYWTTNFVEVQRAMASNSMSAARRSPIIATYPKMFIPFVIIVPGMIAAAALGALIRLTYTGEGDCTYNHPMFLMVRC